MDTARLRTQRGFTLVELMVVLVIVMPILGSIFATSMMVRDQMQAGETVSAVAESCRIAGQRVALLGRAGLLSTCQIRATQADINAAIAAQIINPLIVIPTLGQWIDPPVAEVRPTFRFNSADGVLSMNAAALTPMREFEFFMDPGETANGTDDDADGMVDEGRLQLRIGTSPVQLVLAGVERCEFSLSGRLLTVRLACARRDQQGRLYRAAVTHTICMRNN